MLALAIRENFTTKPRHFAANAEDRITKTFLFIAMAFPFTAKRFPFITNELPFITKPFPFTANEFPFITNEFPCNFFSVEVPF